MNDQTFAFSEAVRPTPRSGVGSGAGFGAWLRPLENFAPAFRVQSASGPEEWRHAFSEPFATWEEAAKLMRELHDIGCRARVIRETVVREIYEVPNK